MLQFQKLVHFTQMFEIQIFIRSLTEMICFILGQNVEMLENIRDENHVKFQCSVKITCVKIKLHFTMDRKARPNFILTYHSPDFFKNFGYVAIYFQIVNINC